MAPDERAQVLQALEQVVGGDPSALSLLIPLEHAELREAAFTMPAPLVVSRAAAVAVLRGWYQRLFSSEQAQGWASFVRRGYITNRADGPIRPIDIEFEEAWEEAISEAVSRLDEIGDAIDGDLTKGEVLGLLQLLGEP